MSKNIKTLVCCILALVFVAGTVVAVFADNASLGFMTEEVSSEDVTVEDVTGSEDTTGSEDASEATTTYLMGDVNLDGKVEAADARLALRVAAQLETLDDVQLILADVNADNKIIAADARAILRVAANLDPAFGTVEL